MQHAFQFEEDYIKDELACWEHSEIDKGQVYTRPEVVDFMLDCIGLNGDANLEDIRILEPSCGEGEFVTAIAKRLIDLPHHKPTISQLLGKVVAVELVGSSIDVAKDKIRQILLNSGYLIRDVEVLLDDWFQTSDFLFARLEPNFTHVIGNPPYVRVENIPKQLLKEYRRRFSTMTDRADLYIPFFEKSLSLLMNGGKLSFICTDRWTKNRYGRALRRLISHHYSLEIFVDLYGADVFEQEVMTYPAIIQILNAKNGKTILLNQPSFRKEEGHEILNAIRNGIPTPQIQIREGIVNNGEPWLLGSPNHIELIRKLEHQYPRLEDAGCQVFIGAATGANKVYIVDSKRSDIEETRLLPVITANELKAGRIKWGNKYLINTYDKNGVIDIGEYPKLARYLEKHRERLSNRHVAKKDSLQWFKTIDRVYEERAKMEKLLIPDIANSPVVVYDRGIYYPNNSIYYICSNEWNLHALRVVLLSEITKIFLTSYSTKIAKNYFRFQAQHLRKLRLPNWGSIDDGLKSKMILAGKSDDISCFSALTCELYGLTETYKLIVED